MSKQAEKAIKKVTKEEFAKRIQAMRDKDAEMVTGVFKNLEQPGGYVSFNFKLYKDDDFTQYTFYDNERYTIPRAVARHLNNNCYYREYRRLADGMQAGVSDGLPGSVPMQEIKKVHRYAFNSLEYDDKDMYPSNLVEVQVQGL